MAAAGSANGRLSWSRWSRPSKTRPRESSMTTRRAHRVRWRSGGAHHLAGQPGDAQACCPGAEEDQPLRGDWLAAVPQGGQDAGHHHGRGSLDVVVEAGQRGPVPVEQPDRVVLLEVLPLQDRVGEGVADRPDERVDEAVVVGAAQPRTWDSRGRAGRAAGPRCRCRSPARPAASGAARSRLRRCTGSASRPGCPCRPRPGRRGRVSARCRSPRSAGLLACRRSAAAQGCGPRRRA